MSLNDIPIMAALTQRMKWLNQNQTVISQNIANADTPGYKPSALTPQDFSALVESVSRSSAGMAIAPVKPVEIAPIGGDLSTPAFGQSEASARETSQNGNAVVLEEEMMKLADNQMQYAMITNLYKKNVSLLKAAMGKSRS